MAFTTTRPNPSITTSTDAGVALDQYIDGDLEQAYDNFGYLYDGTAQEFKGSYASVGARFGAIESALTSPVGLIKSGSYTALISYSSPAEAMRFHVSSGTQARSDYIYDNTASTFLEQLNSGHVLNDATLVSASQTSVPSVYAAKSYVDNNTSNDNFYVKGNYGSATLGSIALTSAGTTWVSFHAASTWANLVNMYVSNTSGSQYILLGDGSLTSLLGVDVSEFDSKYTPGSIYLPASSTIYAYGEGVELNFWGNYISDPAQFGELTNKSGVGWLSYASTSNATIHVTDSTQRVVVYVGCKYGNSASTIYAYNNGVVFNAIRYSADTKPEKFIDDIFEAGVDIGLSCSTSNNVFYWGFKGGVSL